MQACKDLSASYQSMEDEFSEKGLNLAVIRSMHVRDLL